MLKSYIQGTGVVLGRHVNDRNSDWRGSRTFPLLKLVSKVGKLSPYLTQELDGVVAGL